MKRKLAIVLSSTVLALTSLTACGNSRSTQGCFVGSVEHNYGWCHSHHVTVVHVVHHHIVPPSTTTKKTKTTKKKG